MNPFFLFGILLALAAAVMFRLSDRALVRILGVSTLLTSGPAIALGTVLDWRAELGSHPTILGYVLVGIGAIGAIFLTAALLSTVLRLALSGNGTR